MSDVTTAAAIASTEVKFRDDLLNASNLIEAKSHLADAATGTVTLPAGWAFIDGLAPEGVTEESYAKHREHEDLITNAATHAGTKIATKMFAENPALQTVTLHGPVHKKTHFEATFKREGTSRNVKSGEVSTYKGAIGVGRLNVVSTRTQSEWQGIKQNMRNMAEAAGL